MPKTKQQKRDEAEERKAAHAARTPNDQRALILDRRGFSERELIRLENRSAVKPMGKTAKKEKVTA